MADGSSGKAANYKAYELMIRLADIQKAYRIARFDGLLDLLRRIPHHVHWRTIKAVEPLDKFLFELRYGGGIDVIEQDWDNLILLDACRYDFFKWHTSFDGQLSRVVSKGRGSWEFIRDNFVDRNLHDTVYVTANPRSERLSQDTFYTVNSVLDYWEPELGTVPPEAVTEAGIEAHRSYPNKRLIIHYMQPHVPHLGELVEELDINQTGNKIFDLYKDGQLTQDELRRSYLETLAIVESEVKPLVEQLAGKTVISADHGENLGESKLGMNLTGHGPNSKEIRFVPWLELPHQERKNITEDAPLGFQYQAQEVVENRLADLGYM